MDSQRKTSAQLWITKYISLIASEKDRVWDFFSRIISIDQMLLKLMNTQIIFTRQLIINI